MSNTNLGRDNAGSTSSDPDLVDRVQAWHTQTAILRASTFRAMGQHAWALLTPEWPLSYAHNGILIRRDPGAAQLIDWADEYLGGAGLDHRYVMAMCELGDHTRAELESAGFTLQPELHMARGLPGEPLSTYPDVAVELVDESTVRQLERRMWREEYLPGCDAEAVRQLTGRRDTYPQSGEFLSYAVRDPELDDPVSADLVSYLDLCVRDSVAEIDGVATLSSHRGRSYGDAMLAAAIAASIERGCGYAILTALADDWPRHWYERRGFAPVGQTWVATKVLTDAVASDHQSE
ncbi:MAG: GNAT family N-acetyltransferase [Actinomycetes bacterium]